MSTYEIMMSVHGSEENAMFQQQLNSNINISLAHRELIKKIANQELGMYDLSEILDESVLDFFYKYMYLDFDELKSIVKNTEDEEMF